MWLQERAACTRFPDAASASASAAACAADDEPGAILLLQSRPGEFASAEIERLHAHVPLARLVALVGPWCEGEMRSGRPPAGVARVPWRSWPSRLAPELGLDGSADLGVPPLPRTASDAERLERSLESLKSRLSAGSLAAVCADRRDRFESLRDSLSLLGVRGIWQWPGVPLDGGAVDLVLIDGWKSWPETVPPPDGDRPPAVLVLDFPRPEDLQRARAEGACAVVAEPMLLADLAWAIDTALVPS